MKLLLFSDSNFEINKLYTKMPVDAQTTQILYDIANKLRVHSIESTNHSNSG